MRRMQQFAPAQADLQAYLKIRPEDFNAEERLRFVNAKLDPPPAATAAAPTPTPTPKPMKLFTRANVFIALGGLVLLVIIVIVIAKLAMKRGIKGERVFSGRAVARPGTILSRQNAMNYKRATIMGWAALTLCVAVPGTNLLAKDDDADFARKAVELAKKKDYTGAAEQFTRAIEASPKTARHYSNRGKAYRAAGKLAEAEEDFTKVLELERKTRTPSASGARCESRRRNTTRGSRI